MGVGAVGYLMVVAVAGVRSTMRILPPGSSGRREGGGVGGGGGIDSPLLHIHPLFRRLTAIEYQIHC